MATNYRGTELSGGAYVSIQLRDDGDVRLGALLIVSPANCNHGDPEASTHGEGTACETAECLNSWSLDWRMFLTRTIRGRAIIERFHLTDEQVAMLASTEHRPIYTDHDPFARQYDKVARRSGFTRFRD